MSTHESFIYNLTKIDIMLEYDKNIPKNKKLFLRIIVPLTIPLSNFFYLNLTDIYSLKELLYNEGIADINGLPLVKPDNSVHSLLPNGY